MDDEPTPPGPEPEAPAIEELGPNGAEAPAARWVRVSFGESGQVLIDWAGIGPVEILGAAGYMEWQAHYLLNTEMANRPRRVIVPGDHLGPGGQPRGN